MPRPLTASAPPERAGGDEGEVLSALPLRADAQRNRALLMAAATAAFAERGAEARVDEIARRAGVGIGTLYRHFPTREALIEAVYRHEVEQVTAAATRLASTSAPGEALHRWMQLFVDYVAAKKVLASALGPVGVDASARHASSGARITDAVTLLVERAVASGDIRPDVAAGDLVRALVGFTAGGANAEWEPSARRLIDVLMDGLRTRRTDA